jgi:hypothetical protein
MAVYHCAECDALVDDDWHPCTEGPDNTLICPSCCERLEDDEDDTPKRSTLDELI